ncbi:MAG: hypothetical protein QGD89_03790 [Actinomycetota bacterium]|nr:hypothetical protein [Actinomycetota bacterium]
MTPEEIDAVLTAAEHQIGESSVADLRAVGFWRAVHAVKGDPALINRFADRIGAIDGAAFTAWARLLIPISIGTALALIAAALGVALIALSPSAAPWSGLVFLAGTGTLIGATHGLGHLVVGRVAGIRFTAWFVGRGRPQPGVKTDYATYLRTSPRSRAWMHASGAIVTKTIPFLVLPAALAMASIPGWVPVVLILLGIVQIITDIAWSTKSSDWAKYRREMRYH